MKSQPILRGGDDLERVYLYDAKVSAADGRVIEYKKTNIPAAKDPADVFMRHIGRYGLAITFLRPGFRVLDFPCGSGLALEVISGMARFGNISYTGWELEESTVLYAREVYGKTRPWAKFEQNDLTKFTIDPDAYDTICCIEGIEHVGREAQIRAVREFSRGLVTGGTFIVSSPPPEGSVSGPNPKNPFHVWELTREDFAGLLEDAFGKGNVELISQKNLLTTGQLLMTYYAVCHKR